MEMKREILGNAPWRIDSLEEKRLGALADTDEIAKKEYVRFYQDNCPETGRGGRVPPDHEEQQRQFPHLRHSGCYEANQGQGDPGYHL